MYGGCLLFSHILFFPLVSEVSNANPMGKPTGGAASRGIQDGGQVQYANELDRGAAVLCQKGVTLKTSIFELDLVGD